MSKRIIYKEGLYNAVTALSMVSLLLYSVMYTFSLKSKARAGHSIIKKHNYLVSFIVLFISMLNIYVVGQIESALMVTSLLPVISLSVRSFHKGKILFSKSYIFGYKPLQIALPFYLLRVKPPFTLFPRDESLSNCILIYSTLVYLPLIGQVLYHPKLWKKNQYLEWKKWQPKIIKREQLPPDTECNICLEKLGGTRLDDTYLTDTLNDGIDKNNGGTLMPTTIDTGEENQLNQPMRDNFSKLKFIL